MTWARSELEEVADGLVARDIVTEARYVVDPFLSHLSERLYRNVLPTVMVAMNAARVRIPKDGSPPGGYGPGRNLRCPLRKPDILSGGPFPRRYGNLDPQLWETRKAREGSSGAFACAFLKPAPPALPKGGFMRRRSGRVK